MPCIGNIFRCEISASQTTHIDLLQRNQFTYYDVTFESMKTPLRLKWMCKGFKQKQTQRKSISIWPKSMNAIHFECHRTQYHQNRMRSKKRGKSDNDRISLKCNKAINGDSVLLDFLNLDIFIANKWCSKSIFRLTSF